MSSKNEYPYEAKSTWWTGGINSGAAFDNVEELIDYIVDSPYAPDSEYGMVGKWPPIRTGITVHTSNMYLLI